MNYVVFKTNSDSAISSIQINNFDHSSPVWLFRKHQVDFDFICFLHKLVQFNLTHQVHLVPVVELSLMTHDVLMILWLLTFSLKCCSIPLLDDCSVIFCFQQSKSNFYIIIFYFLCQVQQTNSFRIRFVFWRGLNYWKFLNLTENKQCLILNE